MRSWKYQKTTMVITITIRLYRFISMHSLLSQVDASGCMFVYSMVYFSPQIHIYIYVYIYMCIYIYMYIYMLYMYTTVGNIGMIGF